MFEDIIKKKSLLYSKIRSVENTPDKEKLFDEIDDEAAKIKQDINYHYDNMANSLSIFNNMNLINNSNDYCISDAMNIKGNDLREKTEKLQEMLSLYYMDKGDYFQKQGKFNEALDSWEKILKTDPANDHICLELKRMTTVRHNDIKRKLKNLENKYKFKYIGNFGSNKMKKPMYMCVSETAKKIFISDYTGHKIHRFTVDGESDGTIPVEVKNPLGLFIEEENKLWVCDSGNGKLLCVDFKGKVSEEIDINKILNNNSRSLIPFVGCIKNEQIYLSIMADLAWKNSILISFNKKDPTTSLKIIPTDNLQLIVDMQFINDDLFVANHSPGQLFVFNQDFTKNVPFADSNQISGMQQRFLEIDNALFVTADRHVLKLNSNGSLVFAANLKATLKNPQILTNLAVLNKGDKKILLVGDSENGLIHMFSI